MRAEFGHQPTAGAVEDPPADQLVNVLVAVLLDERLLAVGAGLHQRVVVLLDDRRVPAVFQDRLQHVASLDPVLLGHDRPRVVAVPQGADVLDVADDAGVHDFERVGVQHRVVPLVADRQDDVVVLGRLDHRLTFGDVVGHELFAQHVLAALHALDGHRRVQVQGQGDHDRFDVLLVVEHLPVVFVEVLVADLGRAGLAVVVDEALAERHLGVAVQDALLVERPDVARGDELDELRIVLADEDAALVAAADDRRLDRLAAETLVAEVDAGRQWDRGGRAGGGADERAAVDATAGRVEVLAADVLLLGSEVECHE